LRELVISRDEFETRVALLEEGRLVEYYVERPGRESLVGNIYKGRVENVLAGMDAAFVDIGLDRNGYLCADEVLVPEGLRSQARKITNLLRSGKEILVQVVRDPVGSKGPRLTTQLGIAGRFVVYLPVTPVAGVSRRLEEAERERLRAICRAIAPPEGGLIIRTAAEGADEGAIRRDLEFVLKIWKEVKTRAAGASAPALVYAEADLAVRAVRDLLGFEWGRVVVDDARLHQRLKNYLRAVAPEVADEMELCEGELPLIERLGLQEEAKKALARRVELPSGGYLVIDHTEAMTVIDVNTGRYVGKRTLEDTSVKTNVEACREIVRQLRLRDIGGIIVIDFIDMASPSNREAVLATLEAELAQDRSKTYVVELSPLGLVEMTRQSTSQGLREVLTVPCLCCCGEGRVLSQESAFIEVYRRISVLASASKAPLVRVEVHPNMAARLRADKEMPLARLERKTGRQIQLEVGSHDLPLERVTLVSD